MSTLWSVRNLGIIAPLDDIGVNPPGAQRGAGLVEVRIDDAPLGNVGLHVDLQRHDAAKLRDEVAGVIHSRPSEVALKAAILERSTSFIEHPLRP
jgi:hypothetical protein